VRWARELNVRGVRVFDLQIALMALDNGARELWSHDAAFVAMPGIQVRDPMASGFAGGGAGKGPVRVARGGGAGS
jgi:hypothetical protein